MNPLRDRRKPAGAEFRRWHLDARVRQVRYVAFLTAALYFGYTVMEWQWGDNPDLARLQSLRGLAVGSLLCLIGLMSYRPKLHGAMRLLLVIAPVSAVAGNLYLSANAQEFSDYAPEIYLAIIWTFSVSGLTLWPALASALASVGLALGFAAAHPMEVKALHHLHLLWMGSAFAFGLLGAALLQLGYRELFTQQLQLKRLATVDDVTLLWNRRHIRDHLAREAVRSDRTADALSIIILDLDHFKRVNDQYGHVVGDSVLRQFGRLLRHSVRATDLVGRFGGEEFMIVLPATDARLAGQVAEKLRGVIAEHHFDPNGRQTASFGVADYRPGEALDDFIHRADAALYRAKHEGRDRVIVDGN
jgi:diguanylate cyclase (GGDEF)-like protein